MYILYITVIVYSNANISMPIPNICLSQQCTACINTNVSVWPLLEPNKVHICLYTKQCCCWTEHTTVEVWVKNRHSSGVEKI